jgi:hypothetical protein
VVAEIAGLTEAQIRTLRIADNKIALNAGWDVELLQKELIELAALDVAVDPTLTGFSVGEIDVLLDQGDDPDDEAIPLFRHHPAPNLAMSGSWASVASDAGTHVTWTLSSGLLAQRRRRTSPPESSPLLGDG